MTAAAAKPPTVAFWAAYVATRPAGASFADWFAKPRSGRSSGAAHGLGYGDGTVTVLLTLIIAVLVGYLAVTRTDVQRRAEPVPLDATSGRLPVRWLVTRAGDGPVQRQNQHQSDD